MNKLKRIIDKSYVQIINSIAFYPSLISIGFLCFSFLMVALEYQPYMIDVKQAISLLLVEGSENGRLILGTVVGSIFSLMVFSFSMVMLVLNRASATMSPRVVPGLITQNSHQIILGIYLGTIIYTLILITNIRSSDVEHHIPTMGILFSIIFAIICLWLFVYFIHSISIQIQPDNILDDIFRKTKNLIVNKVDKQKGSCTQKIDTEGWREIFTDQNGYLKRVNTHRLANICKKNNIRIFLTRYPGDFLIKAYPFLKVNQFITDELEEEIRTCFIFYVEERVSDHYLFGFKQITEIAIKALSPGINDPFTAHKAIDMLSVLFVKHMALSEYSCILDSENNVLIQFTEPSLEELMHANLTAIHFYGKEDASVIFQLLVCLKNMAYVDRKDYRYQQTITAYTRSITSSINTHIHNPINLEQLNYQLTSIENLLRDDIHFTLSPEKD